MVSAVVADWESFATIELGPVSTFGSIEHCAEYVIWHLSVAAPAGAVPTSTSSLPTEAPETAESDEI